MSNQQRNQPQPNIDRLARRLAGKYALVVAVSQRTRELKDRQSRLGDQVTRQPDGPRWCRGRWRIKSKRQKKVKQRRTVCGNVEYMIMAEKRDYYEVLGVRGSGISRRYQKSLSAAGTSIAS